MLENKRITVKMFPCVLWYECNAEINFQQISHNVWSHQIQLIGGYTMIYVFIGVIILLIIIYLLCGLRIVPQNRSEEHTSELQSR